MAFTSVRGWWKGPLLMVFLLFFEDFLVLYHKLYRRVVNTAIIVEGIHCISQDMRGCMAVWHGEGLGMHLYAARHRS